MLGLIIYAGWTGGLCGLTVERSLAIQKVAGTNLGRPASR